MKTRTIIIILSVILIIVNIIIYVNLYKDDKSYDGGYVDKINENVEVSDEVTNNVSEEVNSVIGDLSEETPTSTEEEPDKNIIVDSEGNTYTREEYDAKWREVYPDYIGEYNGFVFRGENDTLDEYRYEVASILREHGEPNGMVYEFYSTPEDVDSMLRYYIVKEYPDFESGMYWDLLGVDDKFLLVEYNGEIKTVDLEE